LENAFSVPRASGEFASDGQATAQTFAIIASLVDSAYFAINMRTIVKKMKAEFGDAGRQLMRR